MMIRQRNDLLSNTVGNTQYLTWWHIADLVPQHQKMCETVARIICHTSLLKDDDPRCRDGSNSLRNCAKCDLEIPETFRHLVMQCPGNERLKEIMFKEIAKVDMVLNERCMNNADQVFFLLLRKPIDGVNVDVMTGIWITAGYHLCNMYKSRIFHREGVG